MSDIPHQVAFTALLALTEVTRSVQAAQLRSDAFPRSFARWTRQEDQLLAALTEAQIDEELICRLLQRTRESLRRRRERRAGATRSLLAELPQSTLRVTPADVELLMKWNPEEIRDPFGWRFGTPLPVKVRASKTRTLRVVLARPEQPDGLLSSWQNAAQATWTDLAATASRKEGARRRGVLHHAPDVHQARQLALRTTVRRVTGEPARRGGIQEWMPGPSPDWNTALIADPERWSAASIRALDVATVILVLPDAEHAAHHLASAAQNHCEPLLLGRTVKDWAQEQGVLVDRWCADRERVTETVSGWPNSHGLLARVDWDTLRVLPQTGELVCAHAALLLRARVWLMLTQGVRAEMPASLSQRFAKLLGTSVGLGQLPLDAAHAAQQGYLDSRSPTVSLEERVWARVLLDSFYPKGADCGNVIQFRESGLKLSVGSTASVTYIGR